MIKDIERDISILLKTRLEKQSGIIYCISRKDCERLSENLRYNHGIKVEYYHAELPI